MVGEDTNHGNKITEGLEIEKQECSTAPFDLLISNPSFSIIVRTRRGAFLPFYSP